MVGTAPSGHSSFSGQWGFRDRDPSGKVGSERVQPRVLLTALALVVFLIVGALMILGDPESPVLPDAPTVLPETPVDVEVLRAFLG